MVVRLYGLTPKFFIRRPWDALSTILLTTGLIISILELYSAQKSVISQMSRFIQPAIVLLAIPYVTTFQNLLNIAFASLPLVTTLLTTWIVLLLFFAIGLTQAFGLTRFGPHETGYVNFRTVPKALVLLFRMTLGEGRTNIMEDFAAIKPPYCTFGERYLEDDCGNEVLARIFFISWKVLSTYLFTSLFISLVFDSFSCVYQTFLLKSGVIEHDDIRRFKDAWATVDPDGTGYIPITLVAKFTNAITGRLSLRVYDEAYSIESLRRECEYTFPVHPGDINYESLNRRLNTADIHNIHERRRTMERYRMELLILSQRFGSTTQGKISMNTALITLFHYKLVNLREYLA